MNKILAAIVSIVVIVSALGGLYVHLDNEHAKAQKIILLERELLKVKIGAERARLDDNIKKDAEARHHYKDKEEIGEADAADKRRIRYLEDELEDKYRKQQQLRQFEQQLEAAGG